MPIKSHNTHSRTFYVLSSRPEFYSTRRLIQAGTELGLTCEVIDPLQCLLSVGRLGPVLYYRGEALEAPSIFLPRIGGPVPDFALALVAHLENLGSLGLNSSQAFELARNKWSSLVRLAAAGLPIPQSYLAFQAEVSARNILPHDSVIKLLRGAQGRGVMLARGHDSLISLLQGLEELNSLGLVQEYISESQGQDLRILVLYDQVLSSMARQAPKGEFRSNLHRGGQAVKVEPSEKEIALALAATKCMGLDFAGVDIIRSTNGPLVLEVNPSPGLEGIERISGRDLATQVVSALMNRRQHSG